MENQRKHVMKPDRLGNNKKSPETMTMVSQKLAQQC